MCKILRCDGEVTLTLRHVIAQVREIKLSENNIKAIPPEIKMCKELNLLQVCAT